MPTNKLLILVLGTCVFLSLAGCQSWSLSSRKAHAAAPVKNAPPPPHVAGTVAEYCRLVGGSDLLVQGYALVVGLGKNGCSELPPVVRDYMLNVLSRHDIGSWVKDMQGVTPGQVLRDLDTAVVLVAGRIPPGSPKGASFDLFVSALPQTTTKSLDGGILLPAELHLALGGVATPGGPSKILAEGGGAIFINPFADPTNAADTQKFRTGRVPGGGRVKEPRGITLQLMERDYARADAIQKRINARFSPPSGKNVANAINQGNSIAINIPPAQRDDYVHFLRLVTHLPLRSGPGEWEQHARDIGSAMELPTAQHEELALVWEAMGRQVLPVIQPYYLSRNAPTAFWSAVAGVRLGDDTAADVVIRMATTGGSPQQAPAIKELGRNRAILRAAPILRKLLDERNELVRVAAYEALVARRDTTAITSIEIGKHPIKDERTKDSDVQFVLDLVASHESPVIYATQSGQPRIALFGKDMQVSRPLFFCAPDDMVTLNANTAQSKLTVFRKIPRTGTSSGSFQIDSYVRTLVQTLGSMVDPDKNGQIQGLGVNYSQVLAVLQRLCQRGDVPARFVLQQPPGVRDMYQDVMSTGRPDMPGS